MSELENGTMVAPEVTEGTEVTEAPARGYASLTPEQKEAAKAKQVESMKTKWQDPVYQAKVSLGRHAKSVEKLTAEIAEIDATLVDDVTEDVAKTLNASKEKLVAKLAASQAKVDEANAIINASTPVENTEA